MTLIKRKGVEYNSAPKNVKTWGKTLTDRTNPNFEWEIPGDILLLLF